MREKCFVRTKNYFSSVTTRSRPWLQFLLRNGERERTRRLQVSLKTNFTNSTAKLFVDNFSVKESNVGVTEHFQK